MSKAEKFISEHTRKLIQYGDDYFLWVTPDNAKEAVEIAREEILNEIYEWIGEQKDLLEDSFSDPNDFVDILKQAMKERQSY